MHIHSWLIGLNSKFSKDLIADVNSISSESVSLSVEVLSNQDLSKENPDESSKMNDNFSSKVEVTIKSCAQTNKSKVKDGFEYSDDGKMECLL